MRILVRLSCLLTLLGVVAAGQTDQWKKYKYADGNFSAVFPAEPQDSVNKGDDAIQSHTLMAQQSGAVYTVVYTAMTAEQKVDDKTYEVFKNAVFKELAKCEVVAEQAPSLPLSGYIGHWYRLSCAMPNAEVAIVGNLYWGKHYAYAVMTMYPARNAEPATSKDFVNSFAVLDAGK
jgi:hypothetical protein